MAEHKTKPVDHEAENKSAQEGSGRQHPTGTGRAYKAPSKRGTAGGVEGGKRDKHQGGDDA